METISGHFYDDGKDFCDMGQQMSQNVYYRVVMIVRAVLSFVGLVCSSSVLFAKISSVILHIHTRILIRYHVLCTCVIALNYICMSLFDFVRFTRPVNGPCDYLMPKLLSFSFHFVMITAQSLQIISCLLVTIERLVCTLKFQSYENANYKYWLMVGLAVLTLSVICMSYLMLGKTANWNIRPFYLSVRDSNNYVYTAAYIFSQFSLDCVNLILLIWVNFLNRRAKRLIREGATCEVQFRNQLSCKLQIRETLVFSETWKPIAVLHVVLTGVSSAMISTFIYIFRGDLVVSLPINESLTFVVFYTIFMPVLLHKKNPRLFWDLLEKVCRREFRRTKVEENPKNGFNKHFELFDKMMRQE
ncbi:hypothetical protein L596_020019 [Steinernema carpocapsae]|uniref:G-protein coupled receptors family 1 profile domain-containing protein n=1 Tax=Steinernema carpocapsae TaxID=34508 RepID=A0A4U5MSH9_STECR|nr:hypothetical protein L596_020019 [Steinernema carpocapsae]